LSKRGKGRYTKVMKIKRKREKKEKYIWWNKIKEC
jgi:hypothetical protein